MTVLLLSTSARGHAIAKALQRSKHKPDIISFSPTNNPGITAVAKTVDILDVADINAVTERAKKYDIDFAIIGPEDPLAAGVVNALTEIGIPCVGPTKKLAQIESSKGFTRDLLAKHGIDASPKYRRFTKENESEIETYLVGDLEGEYVIKHDGLQGGKGVKLSGEHLLTIADGVQFARDCIADGGSVVVEEKLIGEEFSYISFVSGTQVKHSFAIQDHKRAFEGDTGPNTGGMGTISDANHLLPFLTNADIKRAQQINELTAKALLNEFGEPYKGFLYGGFIAVKNGVRLIEYNARLGDPEALNILPLLETDFVDVCLGIINNNLDSVSVEFKHKATVCKYVVPQSYPDSKIEKGEVVIPPEKIPNDTEIFFGSVDTKSNGSLVLAGSRAIGVTGVGNTINEACEAAEKVCNIIAGPVRFRKDIGTPALLEQRISTMRSLRS